MSGKPSPVTVVAEPRTRLRSRRMSKSNKDKKMRERNPPQTSGELDLSPIKSSAVVKKSSRHGKANSTSNAISKPVTRSDSSGSEPDGMSDGGYNYSSTPALDRIQPRVSSAEKRRERMGKREDRYDNYGRRLNVVEPVEYSHVLGPNGEIAEFPCSQYEPKEGEVYWDADDPKEIAKVQALLRATDSPETESQRARRKSLRNCTGTLKLKPNFERAESETEEVAFELSDLQAQYLKVLEDAKNECSSEEESDMDDDPLLSDSESKKKGKSSDGFDVEDLFEDDDDGDLVEASKLVSKPSETRAVANAQVSEKSTVLLSQNKASPLKSKASTSTVSKDADDLFGDSEDDSFLLSASQALSIGKKNPRAPYRPITPAKKTPKNAPYSKPKAKRAPLFDEKGSSQPPAVKCYPAQGQSPLRKREKRSEAETPVVAEEDLFDGDDSMDQIMTQIDESEFIFASNKGVSTDRKPTKPADASFEKKTFAKPAPQFNFKPTAAASDPAKKRHNSAEPVGSPKMVLNAGARRPMPSSTVTSGVLRTNSTPNARSPTLPGGRTKPQTVKPVCSRADINRKKAEAILKRKKREAELAASQAGLKKEAGGSKSYPPGVSGSAVYSLVAKSAAQGDQRRALI